VLRARLADGSGRLRLIGLMASGSDHEQARARLKNSSGAVNPNRTDRARKIMATTQHAMPAHTDAEHRTQLRRAVIASTIGTTIEWYDFFLYSIVTGLCSPNCIFRSLIR
jgi:hypothetical protein